MTQPPQRGPIHHSSRHQNILVYNDIIYSRRRLRGGVAHAYPRQLSAGPAELGDADESDPPAVECSFRSEWARSEDLVPPPCSRRRAVLRAISSAVPIAYASLSQVGTSIYTPQNAGFLSKRDGSPVRKLRTQQADYSWRAVCPENVRRGGGATAFQHWHLRR